jgi:hypothetical protein
MRKTLKGRDQIICLIITHMMLAAEGALSNDGTKACVRSISIIQPSPPPSSKMLISSR